MTEEQFIAQARAFLTERLGASKSFDADTDLVASGVLDSLLMVEFFFFIEEQRGSAIDTADFSLKSIASLRQAYQLAWAS